MKLRWGILGTASIAETFVQAVRRSDTSVVQAVASRDGARAKAWAADMGIPETYGAYDDLLAAGNVDAVYVPLPNALHAPWTIRSLEAGIPVLCEKPFAMNAGEAREVMAVADRTGLPVAEGFMYRFHPVFDAALRLLDDGVIGALVSIDSRFSFFEDDRTGVVASAALGGGALMDVGCYCVNLSRLVARSEPVRVTALQVGDAVDDTLMGIMEFPGGVLARFETSIASAEDHRAEIRGTEGTLVLPDPWIPGREDTRIIVRRRGEPDAVIAVPGADTYRLEIEDFAAAVTTRRAPRWTGADAVANMAVLDALIAAARGPGVPC
ncbi:MAG: Gfo/Idh/MocA family oxidoreductase [Pseudomonadota bacterium]